MSVLSVRNLKKNFGGLQALRGVEFDIENNQVVGLIGPNGCGKSTTFNCITGFIPPTTGSVKLYDHEITDYKPFEISQLGLSRTFQHTRLWRDITVIDNLLLPARDQLGTNFFNIFNFFKRKEVKEEEEMLIEKAFGILESLEIDHMAHTYASELSGGQSKLVDIARVLMSDPKLLLLDEPVAGVAGPLAEKIFHQVLKLRDQHDLSILIIEHNMEFILRQGIDNIFVMNSGEIIAEGTPDEIRGMEEVVDAYLGQ